MQHVYKQHNHQISMFPQRNISIFRQTNVKYQVLHVKSQVPLPDLPQRAPHSSAKLHFMGVSWLGFKIYTILFLSMRETQHRKN